MSSALTARSFGHRGPIKEISSSPSSPLVSTVDEAKNFILWQSADTTSVEPHVMLTDVSAMVPITVAAWSPEGHICFIANGEGLFAYEMAVSNEEHPSTLPSRLPLTVLEGSEELGPMLFVGVVADPDNPLASPHIIPFAASPPPTPAAKHTSSAARIDIGNARKRPKVEHSVLVCAVSANGERVFVWRVQLCSYFQPTSSDQPSLADSAGYGTTATSTFLTEYTTPAPEHKVTSATLVTESIGTPGTAPRVAPFVPFLLTGGQDGVVRLWCLSNAPKKQLRQMTSFQAYPSSAVSAIRTAYFGRIATTTPGAAELCLWELESATPNYKLERKIILTPPAQGPCPPIHYDWLSLGNGKHVLAIGFGKEVKVYGPQRPKTLQSFEVDWEVTDSFSALPQPVNALAWARDGALIVGSASILYVFSKWRDIMHGKPHSEGAKDDETWVTAFHRNSEYRSLPLYHPKTLLEFLMAGHFERVGFILGKLLKALEDRDPTDRRMVLIPPIMLDEIAGMKKGLATIISHQDAAKKKKIGTDDDDEFDSLASEIREDEILEAQSGASSQTAFGVKEAQDLAELLTSAMLPGVTGPEQMYLLAIIDTYKQMLETQGALDERGVRFLLAVKIYAFVRRSITGGKALNQTTLLQSHDFIWALHSDSQETLLQACLPTEPEWPAVRALGVGYWVTNPTTLRGVIEKVAQAAFKARKDPGDCALYYLALNKKGALSVAYKSVKDQKLVDFLANDFTQMRWKTAAAKNAYALQGKHRYELAAGFFLLSGSLKDAVNCLIQHSQDYQLALVISRLFEGENGPVFNYVLESHILPSALKNNDYPMASIAKWLLKKHTEALTILQEVAQANAASQDEQHNPEVLNFFKFLSGHTLLRNCPPEAKKQDALLRKAAYAYIQANVDFLALEQLEELKTTHPPINVDEPDDDEEEKKDAAGKDEAKDKEEEKKEEKQDEKAKEEEPVNDIGMGMGYNSFGGYSTSFGGFGGGGGDAFGGEESSSGGGGGGKDDWFDDFLGGSATTQSSSSSNFSTFSNGGPSFLGGDAEPPAAAEPQKKEPTKKYLFSLYPAVDANLMLHVVLQVLIEHVERTRRLSRWKEEAPFLYANLKTLSVKSGISETEIVLELIRYCIARQYLRQAWDLLSRFQDIAAHTLHFIASAQHSAPARRHLLIVVNAAHELIGVASHLTSHPLSLTQARHISSLATEMHECLETFTDPIPLEENSLLYSSIYFAEFLSAWIAEEIQVLESLIKITNIKDATEAFKAGHLALEQAEEEALDEDEEKPQNEPANILWLTQLLHLLVLKKFLSNIEEFLSVMQASRAPSSVKLVQHLVRWLRIQQGKLGHIPRNLQKPQISSQTILQYFYDLIKTGKFSNPAKQLWGYLMKVEYLNDYASSIFVTDEKSHDVLLDYKVTFDNEIVVYKDHDILQSFCINAADNQYVAVATTKGIREIDLRQVHVSEDGVLSDEDGDSVQGILAGGNEEYTAASMPAQGGSLGKSSEGVKRLNASYKSIASLPSFKPTKSLKDTISKAFTKEVDHNIIVQWVESHPHDPYYLSGGIDGSVCLWQFGVPEALAAYRLPPHPWVMRCRFNPTGTKFGACDMAGNLALWKFNAPEDALRPFHSMQAHTKSTLDFAFLNNGSFIATVGISTESKRNVCLWDVLQPPHKAMVSAFTDHEAGATSVVYSPRHHLLVSGGKKGGIYVFDIRQNKLMENFKAHTLNTKSLSMDLLEQFAVSGASDGNIKIWDLATLTCREVWEDVHKKQTFVRPTITGVFKSPVSTYGVMAVGVVGDHIYSCGADKRLVKRKFTYGTA